MGLLLRTAFWSSLALLVVPLDFGGADLEQNAGPLQTFLAAREAVTDFSAFCERKPDVCETARSAISVLGHRAREAVRIAYEMLDANFGETQPLPDKATVTGGIESLIENAEKDQVPIPPKRPPAGPAPKP